MVSRGSSGLTPREKPGRVLDRTVDLVASDCEGRPNVSFGGREHAEGEKRRARGRPNLERLGDERVQNDLVNGRLWTLSQSRRIRLSSKHTIVKGG